MDAEYEAFLEKLPHPMVCKGQGDALRMIAKNYWYDWYLENPDELGKKLRYEKIGDWVRNKYMLGKERIFMVTVNPRLPVDVNVFHKQIRKCVKKVWIETWMYCIEWGVENNKIHCHIRLTVDKENKRKPCKVHSECWNTFRRLVDTKMCVNIRSGRREDSFIDYIKGIKDGKPKENGLYDGKMREELGLEQYYESANGS